MKGLLKSCEVNDRDKLGNERLSSLHFTVDIILRLTLPYVKGKVVYPFHLPASSLFNVVLW